LSKSLFSALSCIIKLVDAIKNKLYYSISPIKENELVMFEKEAVNFNFLLS